MRLIRLYLAWFRLITTTTTATSTRTVDDNRVRATAVANLATQRIHATLENGIGRKCLAVQRVPHR
jgi:hypothetical protein